MQKEVVTHTEGGECESGCTQNNERSNCLKNEKRKIERNVEKAYFLTSSARLGSCFVKGACLSDCRFQKVKGIV